MLSQEDVDVEREGYELRFLGKSYAKYLTSTATTTVITPDLEHNNKPENKDSENIYIVGDNLDAIKHLLKSYSGEIKCIYIDPPIIQVQMVLYILTTSNLPRSHWQMP